ncbi:MAG TPA: phosphatidylglycerophosphatase A [Vicinamibacterales bacterium]|jgi:phosphatidylglycerophosphatase A|nr:phosphatidylglycerophosphatase A [Vicinamibacterales bacterium]
MTRLAIAIATSAGAGYFPIAPGTVGSAVGIVIYLLTRQMGPSWQIGLLVAISLVGIWAADVAERHCQREDPGHVIIDEVAGQLMTLLLLNVGIVGAAIGFFVFRILDIIKPWPARQLESLHGGLGIMADDLMAGVYGWIIMWGLIHLVPAIR